MHNKFVKIDESKPEDIMAEEYRQEIEKRRTFAIISHPDAGKTTLRRSFYYMEVLSIQRAL